MSLASMISSLPPVQVVPLPDGRPELMPSQFSQWALVAQNAYLRQCIGVLQGELARRPPSPRADNGSQSPSQASRGLASPPSVTLAAPDSERAHHVDLSAEILTKIERADAEGAVFGRVPSSSSTAASITSDASPVAQSNYSERWRLEPAKINISSANTSASSSPTGMFNVVLPRSTPATFRPPPGLPPPVVSVQCTKEVQLEDAEKHIGCAGLEPVPGSDFDFVLVSDEPDSGVSGHVAPATQFTSLSMSKPYFVEWSITNLMAKLKTSCGCPLVSHSLDLEGFGDLRMHFVPGEAWNSCNRGGHRRRRRSSAPNSEFEAASLSHGAIRLKVHSGDAAKTLKFFLVVGSSRQGPYQCNFERPVEEYALEEDWRSQITPGCNCLNIRLEIVSQD